MSHEHTHSVHTRCLDCQTWGINLPSNVTCGNCGSRDTILYRPPCCFEAENAALKAEVEGWKVEAEHQERMAASWVEPYKALKTRLERAEAELNEMKDYAGHHSRCPAAVYSVGVPVICACGWDAMRDKWREGRA